MGKPSLLASQAVAEMGLKSQCNITGKLLTKHQILKKWQQVTRSHDVVFVARWRCSAKNNRGWRCPNETAVRHTFCEPCRARKRRLQPRYYLKRLLRDSSKRDMTVIIKMKFIKCENCGIPMPDPSRKRNSKLKNWCEKCKRLRRLGQMRKFKQAHGAYKDNMVERQIVAISHQNDKKRIRSEQDLRANPRYIDVDFILKLRKDQDDRCYFCNKKMQTKCRMKADGLTIERLDNDLHLKTNCVLSCCSCNHRSWREGWCPYPWDIAKHLGYVLLNGYIPGETLVRDWVYLRRFKTWLDNGLIQRKLTSLLPNRLCVKNHRRLMEQLRQQSQNS